MSLSDLQDVCMAIESLTTLDLPMVVDLIGIYEMKGPYYTLTMTDWFLQALSVIPRGSWGYVARRFTMCTPTKELENWSVDRIRSNQRSAISIGGIVGARRIVARQEAPADVSPEELTRLEKWWDHDLKAKCYMLASMSNELQR
ncbi:guanosine nucleotide diphosphate dissociation inhibitor 2-like [Dorcoceras hygrometricum]|uniref:Guanosine nucleotide diphosphate dissociation inhibitor 2-like n=1 Tax=Dorcoceras hygrometricum TaxID=472368 RepID=A0A2Z7BJA8_9LAMI|nr:guanosine nucleotide diphosphate dissociation inhibitor 2-like [Dorcoceras hygrometricum]